MVVILSLISEEQAHSVQPCFVVNETQNKEHAHRKSFQLSLFYSVLLTKAHVSQVGLKLSVAEDDLELMLLLPSTPEIYICKSPPSINYICVCIYIHINVFRALFS